MALQSLSFGWGDNFTAAFAGSGEARYAHAGGQSWERGADEGHRDFENRVVDEARGPGEPPIIFSDYSDPLTAKKAVLAAIGVARVSLKGVRVVKRGLEMKPADLANKFIQTETTIHAALTKEVAAAEMVNEWFAERRP